MRLVHRVAAIVLVGLVPVITVQIYNSIALQNARKIEIQQLALRQSEHAASELARIVEGMRSLMTAVTKAPAVRALDTALCSPFIHDLLSDIEYVNTLTVTDATGQIKCAPSPEMLTVNVSDRAYFKESQKVRDLIIGEFLIGRASKKPALPLALSMFDDAGKHVGTVISTLNLDWLSEQLLQRGLPDGGSVTIADRKGVIVARQPEPSNFVGTKIPDKYLYLLTEPEPGVIDVVSQDGTSRVLGYVPQRGKPQGLYVSAGIPSKQSFFDVNAAAWRQTLITLLAVLGSLGAAYLLGRHFVVKPLERLLSTVHSWQEDDLTVRTGLTESQGEVGTLGKEFDRTMDQLEKRHDAINALLRELAHRSKNQLALLMGITNQLAKGQSTVASYRDALTDRLLALSASQDLLLQNEGQAVSMDALLHAQTRSFDLHSTSRIALAGPVVNLSPQSARLIGMAIHELATNATKHGALSDERGGVDISWTAPSEKDGLMEIQWVEHDGPAVVEPTHNGFGRTLLEKIVPLQLGGEAKVTYLPAGLKWTMKFEEKRDQRPSQNNRDIDANFKSLKA